MRWHGLIVRWFCLGLILVAAATAAGVAALQVPGTRGAVLAAIAAAIGVTVPLVIDGPWKRSQSRHERIREIVSQLPGGGRGRLPIVSVMLDVAVKATVHPSIPLQMSEPSAGLSDELPTYIERDADAELRDGLADNRSVFLVLVGPSTAGKTRTALHLMAHELGDWRLFSPSSGKQVTDYVTAGGDLSRVVVWLDDLFDFLLGPNALSVAAINDVLQAPQRTVIIGAITQKRFEQMTVRPMGREDLHSVAPHILRLGRRIDLDAVFSAEELDRAAKLGTDPRVAEAVAYGESRPTEYLAAVPELRTKWKTGIDAERGATAAAARVVAAATLCRIAGQPNPVPTRMMRDAALSLLTSKLKASVGVDWFDHAVTWACDPVRGEVSLLTATADEPGGADGYYVHEALAQFILSSHRRRIWQVTTEIWTIVTQQCSADVAAHVGYAAADAGQFTVARETWTKAAANNDVVAMYNLGLLLQRDGDLTGAERWLTKGADAGGIEAMYGLGILLADSDQPALAEPWLAKGAVTGDPIAMYNFAQFLQQQGHIKRARRWYEKAADHGIVPAIFNLGAILVDSDEAADVSKARLWWSRGAYLGDADSAFRLGGLHFEENDNDRAEVYWRQAAQTGHLDGMGMLGYLLLMAEQVDEAEQWMRKAAEAGHLNSMMNLSSLMKLRGRVKESQQWADRWRRALKEHGTTPTTQIMVRTIPHQAPPGQHSGRARHLARLRRGLRRPK
jgi:TPR repeat protein